MDVCNHHNNTEEKAPKVGILVLFLIFEWKLFNGFIISDESTVGFFRWP